MTDEEITDLLEDVRTRLSIMAPLARWSEHPDLGEILKIVSVAAVMAIARHEIRTRGETPGSLLH